MVRLAGLEPATYGLEVRCSIQLSYRRMVGVPGFEPGTSCSQSRRATKLRHTPWCGEDNVRRFWETSGQGIREPFVVALLGEKCTLALRLRSLRPFAYAPDSARSNASYVGQAGFRVQGLRDCELRN
jgi:hypothetical protein